jgi:protease-4
MRPIARLALALAAALPLSATEGPEGPASASHGNGTSLVVLTGSLPLRAAASLAEPFSKVLTLHEASERIRSAGRSQHGTIALDLSRGFAPTMAAAEELAQVIRASANGKRVICLLEHVDDAALLVAAVCDEVAVAEAGLNSIDGVALDVDHYQPLLQKLGVRFTAVTSGPEKTAPEPLTRATPSEAAQNEYRRLLEAADAVLVAGSQRGRFDAAALRTARAAAPQFGGAAVAVGIADRAIDPGAWRQGLPAPVNDLARRETQRSAGMAGLMEMLSQLLATDAGPRHAAAIAVVELEGTIVDGSGDVDLIGGDSAARLLDRLALQKHIKAVVLRINSGGGSAAASDRIHQAVRRLDAVKPVVALCDGAAASGGYYIACAAREVHMHRSTITGSIGVFALVPDLVGTRELLGIHRFSLKSDPVADIFSTNAVEGPRAEALRRLVDTIDERFQSLVAGRRQLTRAQVAALADGKVYLGDEAVRLRLADRLGDLAGAARQARILAGVADPLPLEIHPKPLGLAGLLGLEPTNDEDAAPAGRAPRPGALGALSRELGLPPAALHLVDLAGQRHAPLVLAWSAVPALR